MLKSVLATVSAVALSASPVLAAPAAPASNPAAKLSVSSSVRAGSTASGDRLAGSGAIVALVLAAAIVAGGIIIAVDDNDDSPDSP